MKKMINEQYMAIKQQALASAITGYGAWGYHWRDYMEGDIYVINVKGSLTYAENVEEKETAYEVIRTHLELGLESEEIKSILLMINSPGGNATGCFELCDFILKARAKKQINCYIQGLGCSAAYALASCCNSIYASPYSEIGCVGVINVYSTFADIEAEENKKFFQIFRSKNASKKSLSPSTEEGRAEVQKSIDFLDDKFYEHIALGRGIEKEKAIENFGYGLTFNAETAKEIGMINEVNNYDEVIEIITNSSLEEVKGEETVMEDNKEEFKKTSMEATTTESTPNATEATLSQEELVAQGKAQERARVSALYALKNEANADLIEKAIEDGSTAKDIGLQLYQLSQKSMAGISTLQSRANEMSNIITPAKEMDDEEKREKQLADKIAMINKARGGI